MPSRHCYQCHSTFDLKYPGRAQFFCSRKCGTVFSGLAKRKLPAERFWAKVKKTDDCWVWTGNMAGKYGRFWSPPKTVLAHRFSYQLAHGPFDPKKVVCHRCDNPVCVRPDHLFLGTHKDNTQDAIKKGRLPRGDNHYLRRDPSRAARGERNGFAKINPDVVREIRRRADKEKQKDIAKALGVSPATVSHVITGRKWKHVV